MNTGITLTIKRYPDGFSWIANNAKDAAFTYKRFGSFYAAFKDALLAVSVLSADKSCAVLEALNPQRFGYVPF